MTGVQTCALTISHVQRDAAAGTFLIDDDSHGASLDALAEREPAAAGETGVRESLQHVAIILHSARQRFIDGNTGTFVAHRATATDGLA